MIDGPASADVLSLFHPVVQSWFRSRFAGPTEPQQRGWPSIASGAHTLIAAPTGSGKTLTAFLAVIDRLFREAVEGKLPNELRVVYISPLRALSNDMQRNLQGPLAEIQALAQEWGIDATALRSGLRTGDTTSSQRAQILRRPPQILVTTPESLYLMLTSEKGRNVLSTTGHVIVDEIHALVRDKRGSHLALSLERLEALADHPIQRIGLSATQKPIERMADFLVGARRSSDSRHVNIESPEESVPSGESCRIVDVGHVRQLDLGVEIPSSELQAVCSYAQWDEINTRIVELINSHRSTLIFVNTRRLAERLTHQLTQLLGEDAVASHHGSLSKEIRLSTEQRLKHGQLKAVVATSSLELGIDVGYIDLVLQVGSPRSIAAFLQRIGRSGHALGLVPKGRLIALTRDELVECLALLRAIRQRRLDVTLIPEAPLDILAQQVVAEVSAQEWDADELYDCFTRAWPYRQLSREHYEQALRMLASGLTPNSPRGQSLIHYDRINRRLRGKRHARLTALSNGGAIGEVDTVRVVLDGEGTVVGSVDEEFAVESMGGDIFLLGNTSWRIHGLRGNDLIVSDAQGAPPTIPFWRGEAPGRTMELSEEISRLREDIENRLIAAEQEMSSRPAASVPQNDPLSELPGGRTIAGFLMEETCCGESAATQTVIYMASQRAAIGLLPTQKRIVFERFFDESGGMQLVVHAPFGGRITRGWGLAFRKRFCRSFDFELQATADDDGFILSLGPQHSFPIESLFPMMRPDNARNLLEQALLVVPMFHLRWRWNVSRSLFVERMRNAKKVPPALQRFRSEDLLTAVFPKLTGCQENIVGDHEIPDHPLVRQTMEDCLHEALDIDALIDILARIESGDITLLARDTREPSPFAYELLNANPYAFLDGGEAQERRARAVATRRSLTVNGMDDLGQLDAQAIADVVQSAQPDLRDPDELHEALLGRIVVPAWSGDPENTPPVPPLWINESGHAEHLSALRSSGRAVRILMNRASPSADRASSFSPDSPEAAGEEILSGFQTAWVSVERWSDAKTLFPEAVPDTPVEIPPEFLSDRDDVEVLVTLLRGWLETSGPVTAPQLASILGLPASRVFASLEAIEGEGAVLRGRFTPGQPAVPSDSIDIEWCHRRLLARIHRRTISGLRAEIEAVNPEIFVEFLARHQGVVPGHHKSGSDGVHEVIAQLQGIDLPAGAWETRIFPQRIKGYSSQLLDELCLAGEVGWGRLEGAPKKKSSGRPMSSMTRAIPVSLFLRDDLPWLTCRRTAPEQDEDLSESSRDVLQRLQNAGALFFTDLQQQLQLLPSQLADLLGELVAAGRITADGFAGLRQLIQARKEERQIGLPSRYRRRRQSSAGAGRWTLLTASSGDSRSGSPPSDPESAEDWAWQLIRRWGVVFRELVLHEPLAPQWWELLRVYRRLEARGELRGGRFVRGVGGEQFALSDAVRQLRTIRSEDEPGPLLILSAADPLNLTGIIDAGPRIPALTNHQLALRKGRVVAWKKGDETWLQPSLPQADRDRLSDEWGLALPRLPGSVLSKNGAAPQDSPEHLSGSGEPNGTPEREPAPPASRRSRARRHPPTSIPRPFPF